MLIYLYIDDGSRRVFTFYLPKCELLIDNQGQQNARQQEENLAKGVVVSVISLSNNFVIPHVPNNTKGAHKKYQLHGSVV